MLKLHELPGDPGKRQKKKRVGRGEGSGWGRSAGRGTKGHLARSGGGKEPGFEGGQMKLIRRIPKFGFKNEAFRLRRAELTLDKLNRFEDGAVVDLEALRSNHLIPRRAEFVKVIATGKLARRLTVRLHAFSAGARRAIEAAGGACETVAP